MPNNVEIDQPRPGGSISPSGTFSGSYELDNPPLNKIVVRVVFPPASMNNPLVYEMNASPNTTTLKWTATFPSTNPLPSGLDANVTAELFVTGTATRVDAETIEDVDIVTDPVGTIGPIKELNDPFNNTL